MLTDGRTYEWMNVQTEERTNRRKLACLCLPAKAGVTKRINFEMVKFASREENSLLQELITFGRTLSFREANRKSEILSPSKKPQNIPSILINLKVEALIKNI